MDFVFCQSTNQLIFQPYKLVSEYYTRHPKIERQLSQLEAFIKYLSNQGLCSFLLTTIPHA